MSFYSGQATSFADLLTKVTGHVSADGWAFSSGILSKDDVAVSLIANGTVSLKCKGDGDAPNSVGLFSPTFTLDPITWPIDYRVFVAEAPDMIAISIAYNDVYNQHMIFGQGVNLGVTGDCQFVFATYGENFNTTGMSYIDSVLPFMSNFNIPSNAQIKLDEDAAFFGQTGTNYDWVGQGNCKVLGYDYCMNILGRNPNQWNAQSLLVPVRLYANRPDNRLSYVAELPPSLRVIRNTFFNDGDIFVLGSDKWMILSAFKKSVQYPAGNNANESGTFGFAFKYDGP
jgi:hypothetical protein